MKLVGQLPGGVRPAILTVREEYEKESFKKTKKNIKFIKYHPLEYNITD